MSNNIIHYIKCLKQQFLYIFLKDLGCKTYKTLLLLSIPNDLEQWGQFDMQRKIKFFAETHTSALVFLASTFVTKVPLGSFSFKVAKYVLSGTQVGSSPRRTLIMTRVDAVLGCGYPLSVTSTSH